MNEIIRSIESAQLRTDIPKFNVGDTVRVFVKVVEGTRERLQAFEGVVIARRNGSVRETLARASYFLRRGCRAYFPGAFPPRGSHRGGASSSHPRQPAQSQRQGCQGKGEDLIVLWRREQSCRHFFFIFRKFSRGAGAPEETYA